MWNYRITVDMAGQSAIMSAYTNNGDGKMELRITHLPSGQVRAEVANAVVFADSQIHAAVAFSKIDNVARIAVSRGDRNAVVYLHSLRDQHGAPLVEHNLRKALRG